MIPEVNPYNNYRGDGVATLFDYDFFIQNGSQLIVEHIDENDVVTRLEENIDYEIVVIEEEFAGYIKFPIEDSKFGILQENETLSLQLTLPFEQISEYGQSSLLDLNSIEFSLDYLTRLCQILKRQMERSVRVNEGSEATPEQLLETINNNAIVSTNAAALASKKADEAMESANVAINASEEIDNKIKGFNESFGEMLDDIENKRSYAIEQIETLSEETLSDIKDLGVETRANLDLSNLSEEGEKHFLGKSNITNCITEIPQRIKLEFNDGVLTLKAGSEVIVPNGFEEDGTTPKFDVVTIENNTIIDSGSATTDTTYFIFVNADGLGLNRRILSGCASGTSDPATKNTTYYNTSTNILISHNTKGDVQVGLPIAIGTALANGAGWKSIDQVFNGMGYIGSTIWVDKGVKGLIPNGRNEDGTLRNIETVSASVKVFPCGAGTNSWYFYTGNSGFFHRHASKDTHFVQNQKPTFSSNSNYAVWYSPSENFVRFTSDGGVTWEIKDYFLIGKNETTSGAVTSFNPKQPFRAVDYNDKQEIISWGIPDYENAITASWTTSKPFIAPSAGVISFNSSRRNGGWYKLLVNGKTVSYTDNANAGYVSDTPLIPVAKGDRITEAYSGDVASLDKKFYPLKGAK